MSTTATSRQRRSPETAPARSPARIRALTGTRRLIRLAARRDRIVLPVWLLALVGLLGATVASIVSLYPTEAERTQYAVVAATNVVARAFDGPMAGTSLGSIVMTESFGILALLAGIMSVQAVVRHTRADEETGRAELVGSAVVGRDARLVAALTLVVSANAVLGAAATLILMVSGLPVGGSVLTGAALAGVGASFAGVAAVAAQVSQSARGANAIGTVVVGVAFLLRAVGDAFGTLADSGVEVVSAWPSWLSPIGWGQQMRPYGADRPWVLLLFVGTTIASVGIAFLLTRHRDVGAGMVPVRAGPATASRWLTSPAGLAWRIHRGALLGWGVGLVVMGAAIGGISDEVEDLLETSDDLAALIGEMGVGDALLDLYIAFALAALAYATAAYLVQSLLRVRGEEVAGHAEPVLATAVGRYRFLGVHVAWSTGGTAVLLLLLGLAGGVTAGLVAGQWGQRLGDWILAAAVHFPAVLVLGGVVVAAHGWLPRFCAPLAWSALIGSLVIGQFGGLLDLPQAVINLSPFSHVPALPAEELRLLPLILLLGVAMLLYLIGFLGWRHRDLET
jgi:ABC-2 type transport system permease protein